MAQGLCHSALPVLEPVGPNVVPFGLVATAAAHLVREPVLEPVGTSVVPFSAVTTGHPFRRADVPAVVVREGIAWEIQACRLASSLRVGLNTIEEPFDEKVLHRRIENCVRIGRCCDVANHKEQIDVDSSEAFAQQFAVLRQKDRGGPRRVLSRKSK